MNCSSFKLGLYRVICKDNFQRWPAPMTHWSNCCDFCGWVVWDVWPHGGEQGFQKALRAKESHWLDLLKATKWHYILNTHGLLPNLVAQFIKGSNLKCVGSIPILPTLICVFPCPCVGTFRWWGLTLRAHLFESWLMLHWCFMCSCSLHSWSDLSFGLSSIPTKLYVQSH